MKKTIIFFVFVFFFFMFSPLLCQNFNGFWKKLEGPEGGMIGNILVRNDTLYVAGLGGLYRSVDDGEHWEYVGLGNITYTYELAQNKYYIFLAGRNGAYRFDPRDDTVTKINYYGIYSFATLDSIVLMGADYGIYKSTDYGHTWRFLEEDESRGHEIVKIFITSSKVALASAYGAAGPGTYRSTDLGDTWKRVDPDPFAWCFWGIAEVNGALYAYSYGMEGDIYISTDNGLHWQKRHGINAPKRYMTFIHYDSSALYVGTDEIGVYKSMDFGKSWFVYNEGLMNTNVRCMNSYKDFHFLGALDGIYRKEKQKTIWQKKNAGLSNLKIYDLEELNGKIFAGTYGSGLLMSPDKGMTWEQKEIAANRNYVHNIKAVNSTLFALASTDYLYPYGASLFISYDAGESWIKSKTPGLLEKIDGNERFLLLGTEFGLYRSEDQGKSWDKMTNGVPENINVADLAVLDSVGIVVNGTGYIYRSTDYGRTWHRSLVSGLFSGNAVGVIGKKFYIGSGSVNEIFVSEDHGKTWHQVYVPLSNSSVTDFSGDGRYVFAALSGENGVIASSDSGKTWRRIDLGLTTYHVLSILYTKDGELFAGTNGSSVFKFVDGEHKVQILSPHDEATITGNKITFTWHSIWGIDQYRIQIFKEEDLNELMLDQIVDDTSFVFKIDEYNKWYFYRISTVTPYWNRRFTELKSFFVAPPEKDILEQNYPNPFNGYTTVRYHLSTKTRVELSIFDIAGRKVKDVLNKVEDAGTHQITFSLIEPASGVYFLRLKTANAVLARKIILIK